MEEDRKPALLIIRRLIADREKKEKPVTLPLKRPTVFWVYLLLGGITAFALLLELLLPFLDVAVFRYIGKALILFSVIALGCTMWYCFLRMLAQGKTWVMYPYGCFTQIVSLKKDPAWLFYLCVSLNLIVFGGASGWLAVLIEGYIL